MKAQINQPTFNITAPISNKFEDVAIYTIQIEDVGKKEIVTTQKRYSELKLLHESIELTVKELPDFPGSNWMLFRRTNSNDDLIEERRQLLNIYFEKLSSSRNAMNSHIMKSFIRQIKQDHDRQQQKIKNKQKKTLNLRASKKLQTTVKFITPAIRAEVEPEFMKLKRSNSVHLDDQAKDEARPTPIQIPQSKFSSQVAKGILRQNSKL